MAYSQHRRHHLQPLHQRRDLPRPEADPRRLRQQQCRYLRARLPLADRLRPEDHLRHLGRHAGFRQREPGDVIVVIGANPTDGHPVFAQPHEAAPARGRQADRHRSAPIDLVKSPHIEADHHLPLKPGTNVAVLTAMAHVIVTEGLADEAFVRARCDSTNCQDWAASSPRPERSPEARGLTGVPAAELRAAPASMRPAAMARSIMAWASPSTARARRW
jgi:predicted molibdopterin-dependent oxidoreductase YjgC